MRRIEISITFDAPELTLDDFDRIQRRLEDPEIVWSALESLGCDDVAEEIACAKAEVVTWWDEDV